MKTSLFFLLVFVIGYCAPACAGNADAGLPDTLHNNSHLRISLMTGGPGEEVWETFGHACIRVIDSSKIGGERDVIYNYGFFDSNKGSIMSQFLTGRVEVFLDTVTYDELIYEYVAKKRRLTEQELLLSNAQKEKFVTYLKNNLRNDSRYYQYDTFFDNCSTRIFELFRKVLGKEFAAGQAVDAQSKLTFRDVSINRNCPEQNKYWFGLGLNLFFAGSIDNVMSNEESMFLPVYLSKGIGGARIDGQKICNENTTILEEGIDWNKGSNSAFLFFAAIAVLSIAGLLYRRKPVLSNIITSVFLLSTGLLGCLILYTCLLDGEPSWRNNLNLLWALPTNALIPFVGKKFKAKYALVALACIGLALILNILRIQVIPLFEIGPLLLILLWIFCVLYRKQTAGNN